MIKRTLYFSNPAYLSLTNGQLHIQLPEIVGNDTLPEHFKKQAIKTIPVEDIGIVLLDHQQITITQALMGALVANNTAIITCNSQRMPTGMFMPLDGNTLQSERFKEQIEASQPLKKQLWQQTIAAKITNQAAVLKQFGIETQNMLYWADNVKSGDVDNHEARAAAYYWQSLSPILTKGKTDFKRGREEAAPNNLLNYGYAILRAIVARALVGTGLLPILGIHHRNKYNAYCLADDIMEPYRPYIDLIVIDIIKRQLTVPEELTKEMKSDLLNIATVDVGIDFITSPLMIGVQRTTASLYKCYSGEIRKLAYPVL
jgi:CRISPR-associated protein Cas1